VTLIDFPQMVSLSHENAKMYVTDAIEVKSRERMEEWVVDIVLFFLCVCVFAGTLIVTLSAYIVCSGKNLTLNAKRDHLLKKSSFDPIALTRQFMQADFLKRMRTSSMKYVSLLFFSVLFALFYLCFEVYSC
jgi:hypothetical protein